MNPFDLSGPEFLLFFFLLSTVVIVALVLHRRASESASAQRIDLADPYLIAYLRGGEDETLRVTLVSLIDRGLLVLDGTQIGWAKNARPDSVRWPIEKAVMQKYAKPGEASSILIDPKLKSSCDQYQETLKKLGLLPDESVAQARLIRFVVVLFIVCGVGGIKVFVALQRGRTNVAFLIILMFIAVAVAAKVGFPRLTAAGAAMLKDVQTLYSGLIDKATFIRPGGATIEAMMLAAAFGVGALAGDGFAYTRMLFPSARRKAEGSWSSSCGSSCGVSSGSSCGSSCGGGCGGGCGGCGS